MATRSTLLLSACLLAGCEQYHNTRTGWMSQQTPYPTTVVEWMENADGADLGAILAADFNATGLEIKKTRDGVVMLEIKADEIGAVRVSQLEAMAANIEAMNGRVDVYGKIVEAIAEQMGVPIP